MGGSGASGSLESQHLELISKLEEAFKEQQSTAREE